MRLVVMTTFPAAGPLFVGGTLAKHAQNGDDCYLVSLSAGEAMTNIVPEEQLIKDNTRNLKEAARVLGIREARVLDFKDTDISNSPELKMVVNNLIRELKPDLLITHTTNSTHPDFKEAANAVVDASFLAMLQAGKWARDFDALGSHMVSKLFTFEVPEFTVGFEPDVFIDITDYIDVKTEAVGCLRTSRELGWEDIEKWTSRFLGQNRYWGQHSGVKYAEPFKRMRTHEIHIRASEYLSR